MRRSAPTACCATPADPCGRPVSNFESAGIVSLGRTRTAPEEPSTTDIHGVDAIASAGRPGRRRRPRRCREPKMRIRGPDQVQRVVSGVSVDGVRRGRTASCGYPPSRPGWPRRPPGGRRTQRRDVLRLGCIPHRGRSASHRLRSENPPPGLPTIRDWQRETALAYLD